MHFQRVMLGTAFIAAAASLCVAGGESSYRPRGTIAIPRSAPIPNRGFGPDALLRKNPPAPAPYRPIGWGSEYHEAYGPTYYYPSFKSYEGLHPQYYPFFKPRLWPNYKAAPLAGGQCGPSRSCGQWDSYDDWMRDARYGERQ